MHQILETGASLLVAPVLTAALVVAGVVGMVLGPRTQPASEGWGTASVAVGEDASHDVRLGPATKYVLDDDGTVRRVR